MSSTASRVIATCASCGASVLSIELADDADGDGSRVVLERHEAASGPGRYAVWDDSRARPVAARAEVLAYPLHQCSPPMPR